MSENPMIEQVNRLVSDALAGGEGEEVFLPQVGSLYVERRPARRLSRSRIEPPYRVVSFSSQPRGRSLVERIAEAAQCDAREAQDFYDRWLQHACEGDAVMIEGVGVLKFKNFTPDAAFDRLLNPQGHDVVRVRPAHRFDWTIWVGIAAILIALGFGGYQFLLSYPATEESSTLRMTEESRETAVAGPDGRNAVPEEGLSDAGTTAETDLPGDESAAPKAEATAAASPAAETPNAGAAAAQPTASAEPASLVSGRRYVVLGVFSTEENAARAVRMVQRKEPSLPYRVYRFGEKFMVSPFESPDAGAAARFVRENEGRFDGIWIYTAR